VNVRFRVWLDIEDVYMTTHHSITYERQYPLPYSFKNLYLLTLDGKERKYPISDSENK
jgi:hypothetical protein